MRIENELVTVEMYPEESDRMIMGSAIIQGTRK